MRQVINQVIIDKKQSRKYLIKDALFNIFSLADQLNQSKSTILENFEPRKIYFLKSLILNFLAKVIKAFGNAPDKFY